MKELAHLCGAHLLSLVRWPGYSSVSLPPPSLERAFSSYVHARIHHETAWCMHALMDFSIL